MAATSKKSNWPVIITGIVCVALLLGLGSWQVKRLQWKQQLIAQRAASIVANPVSMTDIEAGIEHGYDVDFLRVKLIGQYRYDATRYVYRARGKRAGFQVITPFLARSGFIVLVDRGFIDEANLTKTEGRRAPAGEATLTGITRLHARDKNPFTPQTDTKRNVWFWYDLPGMAASLPEDIAEAAGDPPPIVASVFVQLEPGGEPGAEQYPEPEDLTVKLPNNHLQYALTWYAMALVFAVMTWLFVRRRRLDARAQETEKDA